MDVGLPAPVMPANNILGLILWVQKETEDFKRAGDLTLLASEGGRGILIAEIRKVCPEANGDNVEVMGVPILVDPRIVTNLMSLYLGNHMIGVIDPATGLGNFFFNDPRVMSSDDTPGMRMH